MTTRPIPTSEVVSTSIASRRADILGLVGVLAVALAFRLPNLPGRGEWDDDQGAHLLAVLGWVRDGHVPLLGPASSLGQTHHGVLYYWLLAPGAFLSGTNPLVAVLTIMLVGLVGVAATWWLGRTVGGRATAVIAGLLAAISPTAVIASTFVWNPNLVMPGAAVAAAAGWTARRSGRLGWWVVGAIGVLVMLHGHIVSAIFVPPLAILFAIDVRGTWRKGRRKDVLRVLAGGLGVFVVGYLPLLASELQTNFAETRAIVAYVSSGGENGTGLDHPLMARAAVIALRTLSAAVVGPLTAVPGQVALIGAGAVLASLVWRLAAATGVERRAVIWIAATLAWSIVALAIVAPSLAVAIPGLPNDHYHAFLDPLILVTVALGIAALWRRATDATTGSTVGRALAALATAMVVVATLPAQPPLTAADGGWASAAAAATRVEQALGGTGTDVAVVAVPSAKTGDAIAFPLARDGTTIASPQSAGAVVVVCDPRFPSAGCGGPAEDIRAAALGVDPTRLIDRFVADPRRTISVYRTGH